MTRIEPLTISSATTTLRRTIYAAAIGVAIGFSAAISSMQYIKPAMAANESALFAACRMPDVPGAMSVWTMDENEKLKCWRWK